MRFRITVLMLFAVQPAMNALAAPVPPPSAILDIGPPRKGMTAEVYRKDQMNRLTDPHCFLDMAWCDPEVRKLSSVVRLKDARPWLSENLEVTQVSGTSRLRLRFRAGTTAEQVAILDALLRVYLRLTVTEGIKLHEEGLRWNENCILDLEKRIESGQHPDMVDTYRKGIENLRSIQIPERRAEIARLKQITVIKWAK